jgi:hypothetical protein
MAPQKDFLRACCHGAMEKIVQSGARGYRLDTRIAEDLCCAILGGANEIGSHIQRESLPVARFDDAQPSREARLQDALML